MIHHSMWTPQALTRYVNDFYEFKYVILVAILDCGHVEALLPRYRWKLYMIYILAPINCDTKSFSAICADKHMSL